MSCNLVGFCLRHRVVLVVLFGTLVVIFCLGAFNFLDLVDTCLLCLLRSCSVAASVAGSPRVMTFGAFKRQVVLC